MSKTKTVRQKPVDWGAQHDASEQPETRLDRAIRQMLDVEAGLRPTPARSSTETTDAPDIVGIRQSLGMTQRVMADTLGIPVATLRNWEQGRRTPSNAGKLVLRLLSRSPEAQVQDPENPQHTVAEIGKTELVRAVAESAHLSIGEASAAVEAVFATITSQLKSGGDVSLVGFGTFKAQSSGSTGGDVQSGKMAEGVDFGTPVFRPATNLKSAAG